ncbi:MAG: hypothetical protein FWD29_06175 [Micrococcales bacterium]|nr:hypothetical protein [Micrococcales bacterium]
MDSILLTEDEIGYLVANGYGSWPFSFSESMTQNERTALRRGLAILTERELLDPANEMAPVQPLKDLMERLSAYESLLFFLATVPGNNDNRCLLMAQVVPPEGAARLSILPTPFGAIALGDLANADPADNLRSTFEVIQDAGAREEPAGQLIRAGGPLCSQEDAVVVNIYADHIQLEGAEPVKVDGSWDKVVDALRWPELVS